MDDPGSFTISFFTALLFGGSVLAGILGALTGLGGGVVLVPMLVLFLGVDMHYAIGASLISVIATSSGAAIAYLKEGLINLRAGMFLEMATTTGAVIGAILVAFISSSFLSVLFGFVLLYSAALSLQERKQKSYAEQKGDPLAVRLKMDSSYPDQEKVNFYHVYNIPAGAAMMLGAGALSGMLGIGSGVMKVLAMDRVMCLPIKVSTTTSNLMIGVTAAASAGIYLNHGYVSPGLVMPVSLGVLVGSLIGAQILKKTHPKLLRIVFCLAMFFLAVEMIYSGWMGHI
jgi:uncharacterized membrane protein YfcA